MESLAEKGKSASDSDLLLAELVVEQGLVKTEQVLECLRLQAEEAAQGRGAPRLGEILVRKGYLSFNQAHPKRETLGRYVKVSKLGEGGMGEVWKAWDNELQRWVALKLLKGGSEDELARFRREAQMAAHLSHPNIVTVYEAQAEYIAMQFVEGRTLEKFPDSDVRLIAQLIRQAAEAVHYAHEQGIIHRDIKPGNIMVSADVQVFVMDFGLAKSTGVDSKLSISGMILGTPSYMSPEQAVGGLLVDRRSDVYSLGATLYDLLTGRPVFHHENAYEVLKRVVEGEAMPIRALAPRVDRDLETIVMKCLEKDPERRYATAHELAADLDRWLRGEAILAHPPSVLYRTGKWLRRWKAIGAVAAAGIVAVAATLAILIPQWRIERAEKEAARRREQALRELSEIRSRIVLAREWMHEQYRRPAEIRREFAKANLQASEFILRHPDLPQGYYVRAQGRFALGDLKGADEDISFAMRKAPEFRPGWALLGLIQLERYRRALYEYRPGASSGKAGPFLEKAKEWLERSSESGDEAMEIDRWGLPRTREEGLAKTLVRALREAFVLRRGPEAVRILRAAFEGGDHAEDYCLWLGCFVPDSNEKLHWYTHATEIAPHDARAYFHRGMVLRSMGDRGGALADHDKALECDPDDAMAYTNRGVMRGEKGDWDGALADHTRALALDPGLQGAWYNLGGARKEKGDLEGAIEAYTRALELDPRDGESFYARGGVYAKKGDFAREIADYDKAVDAGWRTPSLLVDRGVAHEDRGDEAAALADYDEALRIDPRCRSGHLNRGLMRVRRKDSAGALFDFNEVLALHPRDVKAWAGRGDAYAASGDRANAIASYEQALAFASGGDPLRPLLERVLRTLREP